MESVAPAALAYDDDDRAQAGSVDTPWRGEMLEGGWIETFTGRRFYPLSPRVEDVDIVDIAHALAHQCRYGGHTRFRYSVAEHCVLLADYAWRTCPIWEDRAEYAGLMGLILLLHDCAEGYLSDIPRPIKYRLPQYLEAEARLEAILFPYFALPEQLPKWAKELDSRIVADERPQVMSNNDNPWGVDGLTPLGVKIQGWSPRRAKWEFLRRFYQWHDGFSPLRAAWQAWRNR